MSRAGFLTFVVGIAVAISGAAKLPIDGNKWPDTLGLFFTGCVITIVGLIIWRKGMRAQEPLASDETPAVDLADTKDAVQVLEQLLEPARKFASEIDSLDAAAINERADSLIETYILPFAEDRNSIVVKHGMERGADVLCTMAFGERMLNRVWSASADGHVSEARDSFPKALAAFEQAHSQLSS